MLDQQPNYYKATMKGRLALVGGRYYLVLTDGVALNITISHKFLAWMRQHPEVDLLNTDRVYCGQYKTLRYPPFLYVDTLKGVVSSRTEPHDTFKVTGRVFRVYKNCQEKYNSSNFVLANVGCEPWRFPLKLCFDTLDDTRLVAKTIQFTCRRKGVELYIDSYTEVASEPELLSDLPYKIMAT